jgi:hypothetical protein
MDFPTKSWGIALKRLTTFAACAALPMTLLIACTPQTGDQATRARQIKEA